MDYTAIAAQQAIAREAEFKQALLQKIDALSEKIDALEKKLDAPKAKSIKE
jgi:hypothetical protein